MEGQVLQPGQEVRVFLLFINSSVVSHWNIIYLYPKRLMHFVASNTFIISLLTYIFTKFTLRAIFGLKYLLYSSAKQQSSPSAFGSIRNSAFSSALYRKTIGCNSRHKALVTTMTR